MIDSKVFEKMKELGMDGLLLINDSNIRYVSSYTGSDAYILMAPDQKTFITDARYTEQAQMECKTFTVSEWKKTIGSLEAFIADTAAKLGIRRLGFERKYMSYDFYDRLVTEMPSVELMPTQNIIESFRYIKNEEEIDCIRKAASFADIAFEKILEVIKPGLTENEIVLELEYYLKKAGSEGIGFQTILISGKKTSMPHGIPSGKKIEYGDFITMDFGGIYNGYRSDMTRTIAVGKVDDEQRRIYSVIKEAQNRGVNALKSEIVGNIPDQQVREVIDQAGYIDYYYPGLGHGVGLDIHEAPFMGIQSKDILKSGCVVTVEPGIYIPDWGGVRIEDTVVVNQNGAEILTKASKALIVV
ncbi:Xaa-Pro aminopeptidase [Anaerosolibacter carboniphilus]|uniref:Xaa-Pro aminopeptidase n=1 Tax=Anaerosolibacter carboniphilus TaxID=1417629 RepID=A0A841KQQ6_9FIRM|nr:Xaa-Pro peptidase family protein [Anaerosolibacter carboniphilus]MBB6216074.1 Xaa-Pro aminopeptidase [Anaerosolibacter carboniphilus]